jgi:hypothetical protein
VIDADATTVLPNATTSSSGTKWDPVILTIVPPATGPACGLTLVTFGTPS